MKSININFIMIKHFFCFLFLFTCFFQNGCSQSGNNKLLSPNRAVSVQIVQKNDQIILNIFLHELKVAQWHIGGVKFEKEEYDFTGKLKQKKVFFAKIDEEYTLPTGKVSVYQNKANEKTVVYANEHGKTMNLIVRAYNDGVAFRYAFDNNESMQVKKECTTLAIDVASNVWVMEYGIDAEAFFPKRSPSEMTKPLYVLPALVETPKGQWLLVHEADVLGRSAAASLSEHKGDGKFGITTVYPKFENNNSHPWSQVVAEDGNNITAFPNWATPWRMVITGDTPAAIVESVMTENLNPPSVFDDHTWCKSGVAVFPWWGDYNANSDKELLKRYIDMAQEMGWSLLEFDIALIGSPFYALDTWVTTSWIKEVTDYARERGVLVYGWDERRNLDTPEKRDFIYGKYKELGVDGIKIDFINSFSQRACDFRQASLADAAKHKLMVNFHGEYTPRGERRTYPNLMTQEGIRGSEYYLFANDNDIPTPQHNATVPFTRNVVGPMDYTPTAYSTSRRTTTYAHETALPFVFESGWVVMCDKPEYYLNSPARPVLQEIEASWDEIKYVAGYPGEYIVIARRKGQKWVIAALNAGNTRRLTIPLDFLDSNYRSLLLCEDDKTNPRNQCIIRTVSIENKKELTFEMAENGGFIAIAN